MTEPKQCIICRGRAVHMIAVPADGDGLVYVADVCATCWEFHDVIAQRIREHIKTFDAATGNLPSAQVRGRERTQRPSFLECPHCYTWILPSAAGLCPSCRRNARDFQSEYTSMTIHDRDQFQAICYHCGVTTDRRVTVRRKLYATELNWFVVAAVSPLVMVSLILLPLLILVILVGLKPKSSVYVRLPQCAACAKIETPEPRSIDFGAGEIVLVVHKTFRAAARN